MKTPFKFIFAITVFTCLPNIIYSQWGLNGNAILPTNFLGTTNAQPLNFRTANTLKAVLTTAGDFNLALVNRTYQINGQGVLFHNNTTTSIFVGVGTGNVGASNTFVGSMPVLWERVQAQEQTEILFWFKSRAKL